MIKILIVEDSDSTAELLINVLEKEEDFEIIGRARNGKMAVEMAARLTPDIITMDILMPVMDGIESTRLIMAHNPTPIVVVSSKLDREELRITFRSIEEGALAVVEKPVGSGPEVVAELEKYLVDMVRAMSKVKLIQRRMKATSAKKGNVEPIKASFNKTPGPYDVIAIGASTGGPMALKTILSTLPHSINVPVLIVQHIASGFIPAMVDWVSSITSLNVKLATNGDALTAGTIYFAPDNQHLTITRKRGILYSEISHPLRNDKFCPSATTLLSSVARVCGKRGVGILLSGMGDDGSEGLLKLRKASGRTIIQDRNSSVVSGMPDAALKINAVEDVVELDKISTHIINLLSS